MYYTLMYTIYEFPDFYEFETFAQSKQNTRCFPGTKTYKYGCRELTK